VPRATTERLKACRAAPCTEIKYARVGEAGLENCEERLPNSVR
jgi:hypothetical protein